MPIDALPKELLAFDRDSVRSIDQNGHLHVNVANISKACVNPYFGKEIPGWKELGLQADKIYQMFRDPNELKKAAPTFDGSPLLDNHTPVSAWDHPFGKVVGSTGTDASFDGTYLKNSLVVWTADAIEKIEKGEQKEISCSYSYEPEMTPGSYGGIAYDGIMRNIKANHVALVAAGRAGSDVVVADSKLQEVEEKMRRKYSVPEMAKLAQDKKVNTLIDLLDLLAKDEAEETEEEKKKRLESEAKSEDEETEEEKAARLKKEEADKKAEDEEESEAEAKKEEKDKDDKKAMDAAIQKAKAEVKAEMKALHEASEFVFPWVGKIVAQDFAADVYKTALELKGISLDGIDPSAYRAVCDAYMKAENKPSLAMDSKQKNDFASRFPDADRIKRG
jgi:uncharacterized protein